MAQRKKTTLSRTLNAVFDTLLNHYGPQVCFLRHHNPFELLVSVILSAQCTDKTVNANTPALFTRFPNAIAMASAEPAEIEPYIRAIGLYRSKANYLVETARALVRDHAGEVPEDLESLTRLPGVGRKTANVVLADAFNVPGFAVDTHVKRLLNRLGIAKSDSPEVLESIVNANVSPERWGSFSHLLIVHGRNCCNARRPDCEHCVIASLCAEKIS